MISRRAIFASLLVGAALVAVAQEKTFDLRWKPKQGQQFSYKMLLRSSLVGQSLTMSSDVQLKVVKLAPNGDYTVESRFKNGKLTIGDHSEPIQDDSPEVQTMNAKGEVIGESKESDDDPVGYVLGQVADFSQPDGPVGVGAKWKHDTAAKHGMPAASSTYEVVGPATLDGLEVVKVAYTYKQQSGAKPTTATGFFYVDPRDGLMDRFEADIKNLVLDPASPPAMATLMLTRQR